MKITNRTKTSEVLPLLNEERLEQLLEIVPEINDKSILSMTVGEFASLIDDGENFVSEYLSKEHRALKAFGTIKSWKRQIKELSDFLKKFEIKRTADEDEAARTVLFPSFGMKMMLTCTRYFHLKSLKEAESVPVNEWLAIFQEEASNALFQYRFNKILENKQKSKKR